MPKSSSKHKISPSELIVSAVSDEIADWKEVAAVDLGELTPAQRLAAKAAAAAIARAEQALGLGKFAAAAAKHQGVRMTHSVSDEVLPNLVGAAQSAAGAAVDRLPRIDKGQEKGIDKPDLADALDEAVRRVLAQRDEADLAAAQRRADATAHLAASAAQAVAAKEQAVGETQQAEAEIADAAESEHKGGKPLASLFWIGSLLGLVVWLLLDERRREQTTRVATEASTQVRELMRDLKGYDDEF